MLVKYGGENMLVKMYVDIFTNNLHTYILHTAYILIFCIIQGQNKTF